MLCSHGCGKEGLFYSKNTKQWRCHTSANRCPAKAAKTGKAIKESFKNIDPITGKTSNELRLEKIRHVRATSIDPNTGLSMDVARAYKAHQTKKTVLDSGLTIQEEAAIKISKSKKGKEKTKLAGIRSNLVQKTSIDPDTGLTIKEISVRKRLVTMLTKNEQGQTKFELAQLKGKFNGFKMTQYDKFDILFQGSYEKHFLDTQYALYNIQCSTLIKRPHAIWYFDPTRNQDRLYFPDFLVNTTLYEIKSTWTWNGGHPGSELEIRNIAKLNAAMRIFSKVVLVLDKREYEWDGISPTIQK